MDIVDYELEEMLEDGSSADEIGEYLWIYRKDLWRKRYFDVNGRRLYPVVNDDHEIIGYEWD